MGERVGEVKGREWQDAIMHTSTSKLCDVSPKVGYKLLLVVKSTKSTTFIVGEVTRGWTCMYIIVIRSKGPSQRRQELIYFIKLGCFI